MSEAIDNHVKIFDTTLRDGEQSPRIALSPAEKLEIANQLNRFGVDIIEAGFPITSEGDFAAVQAIAREVEGPAICALARTQSEDIQRAYDSIRDSEHPRIHTFISTSEIHMTHQLHASEEDVKGQARAAVAIARSLVDDVQFSPMDATRANIDFTAEVIQIALDEGATTINIPDTVGSAQPHEYGELIQRLYERVPDLHKVVLSVHCHNDLGLAVANSLEGVRQGARQIEGTINGIGERAGNTALEEIVVAIKTRADHYGLSTSVILSEIARTSRLVSRLTGYVIQPNKAIVGSNAFKHESGIHQDGVLKERTTYEIIDPATLGFDDPNIALGKHSGRHAVRNFLEQHDAFEPNYFRQVFKRFKEIADHTKGVSPELMLLIAEDVQRREECSYRLSHFGVESSSDSKQATVRVVLPGGSEQTIIADPSHYHELDGPIDALFTAISRATDTDYELMCYTLTPMSSGQEAVGEVRVILNVNGQNIIGRSISTDTLEASAWAYLDALHQAATDNKSANSSC
jgi:2-isopropylmalate synthase